MREYPTFRHRVPFQPITARPRLRLPGNARVAVWTVVNVENWDPAAAMPRAVLPPADGAGAAAGRAELGLARIRHARRLLALPRAVRAAGQRGLQACFAVNGRVCDGLPSGCARPQRGMPGGSSWAMAWEQMPMHRVEDQRAA